jgi:DNA-directed RNA polymerase subunit RPC12/RpoP
VNCDFVLRTATSGEIGEEYASCPECGDKLFYSVDISDRKKIMAQWKAQKILIKDSYKLLEEVKDPAEIDIIKEDVEKLRKLMSNTQKAYLKELKRV